MFYTEIPACDALNEMTITGNIVPSIWFQTITKSDLKHPKPNLLAINILSDIVYWYRPTEVRDETTGALLGYRKKFRADLMQRSYRELSAIYGHSIAAIKDAVVFLENLGVIERVFRTIFAGGSCLNNVMYLSLNVDRLKQLTYPPQEISMEEGSKSPAGVAKSTRSAVKISGGPVDKSTHTNTESTPDTTPKTSSQISLSRSSAHTRATPVTAVPSEPLNLTDEVELVGLVKDEFSQGREIPPEYMDNPGKMKCLLRHLAVRYDPAIGRSEQNLLDLILSALAEMACTVGIQNYKDGTTNRDGVVVQLNHCLHSDSGFADLIRTAVGSYTVSAQKSTIRCPAQYVKSVIWTILRTYTDPQKSAFRYSLDDDF